LAEELERPMMLIVSASTSIGGKLRSLRDIRPD